MTDVATIGLAVDSSQVTKADRELKKFNKTGKNTSQTSQTMSAGFRNLAASLGLVVSVSAGLRKLVEAQRNFDIMNASLVTVTGSTEAAGQAFEAIQAFAKETPFSLNEVSDAFVKLSVLGLEPSREALISYGNTASAMGKSLNQLIEAVADASTGEFERLKEFGIKARQNGDQVSLTFKGITTTIGNNADEIQKYLRKIGDNDFAGAMTRRAESLDGALSNLGDSWDQLFLTISKQNAGSIIFESVKQATDAIEYLDTLIASGALEHNIASIGTQFHETGDDIADAINGISRLLNEASNGWGNSGGDAADFIIDAFGNIPANIRALVQIAAVELAVLVDKADAISQNIEATLLNPETWFTEKDKFDLEARYGAIERARMDSIAAILAENDQIRERARLEKSAAVVSFDAEKKRRAARTGELPTIARPERTGPTEKEIKSRKKQEDQLRKNVAALNEWIQRSELEISLASASEEQREKAIQAWELERKGIDLTSAAYADLADRIDDIYDKREQQRKFLDDQAKTAKRQEKIWEDSIGQIQQHFSDGFFDIMQGNFDNLGDAFKSMLDRMIADALAAQLSQALFGGQKAPTSLGSAVTGLFSSLTGGGGGSSSPFSNVLSYDQAISGAFANGTDFAPGGLSLVGERGPEIVSLPRGSQVTPNDKIGRNVTINQKIVVAQNVDRRSIAQVQTAAASGAQRALRRNA